MNLTKTAKYCRHAAERNMAGASATLGILHFIRIGRGFDIAGAEKPFQLAANQGNVHGESIYAIMRLRHTKSRSDSIEMSKYLKLSGDQGLAVGQVSYGIWLPEGFGLAIDFREAARYFGKASRRTHSYGSFNYEICRLEGVRARKVVQRQLISTIGLDTFHSESRVIHQEYLFWHKII
jgi:TPR repeat protein